MKKLILIVIGFVSVYLGSVDAVEDIRFVKFGNQLIPVEVCRTPRVIVTTDYDGVDGDPNEVQDLVHFLIYSYLFDVKGFIATHKPEAGKTQKIEAALDEYLNDKYLLTNWLTTHLTGSSIPTIGEDNLPRYEYPDFDNQPSAFIYDGGVDSPGVQKIMSEANAASRNCPLNVLVWGASTEIAAALGNMAAGDRKKVRVIAIGSTNREQVVGTHCTKGDQAAWTTLLSYSDQLADLVVLDGPRCGSGSGNDTFRTLFSPEATYGGYGVIGTNGHSCYNTTTSIGNVNLYPAMKSEDYMTLLDDGSNSNLRGLLKSSRSKATLYNCKNDSNGSYSIRMADFLTTLYFLNDEISVPGQPLKVQLEADPGAGSPSAPGGGFSNNRQAVYEDYLNKMNDIYNN